MRLAERLWYVSVKNPETSAALGGYDSELQASQLAAILIEQGADSVRVFSRMRCFACAGSGVCGDGLCSCAHEVA